MGFRYVAVEERATFCICDRIHVLLSLVTKLFLCGTIGIKAGDLWRSAICCP